VYGLFRWAVVALLFVAAPIQAQQAPQTSAATAVANDEFEPIPVPEDAPAGSSGPGAIASGVTATLFVVLGIVVISSLAFFPSP
jgi:hypothetical protein